MILLSMTLLLLHQGYALISVITVPLGQPVTFMCLFPGAEYSNTRVKWYKQSIGDSLLLITTLLKATSTPSFEKGFNSLRFDANYTTITSTLTILRTVQGDEAVYHCVVSNWSDEKWSGMYLSLKENTQNTAKYTVVQWSTDSKPAQPGDSVTLQCSIFSDSGHKTCPERSNVHWFRSGLDRSHPDIIYTDEISNDRCDNRSDTSPRSCVYRLSNISVSDAGTYYCALATCGEIIFGNGTKLDVKGASILYFGDLSLLLLCAVLAISVIVIAFLIYAITKNKCDHCNAAVSLQKSQKNMQRDKDSWIYSAVVFTVIRPCSGGARDAKAGEKERVYAAVKAFGLD
ncbi:uncharacterized protein LOC122990520 [Scomber scombrus]|uniref:Uncharacterized protein LOC122990520 n=1 Tax=Scomber scombrus TaxID=13677 RepID=A0AAV1NZN0_SCOSC